MESRDFFQLLKSKKQVVTIIVLVALVLSLGFSFSQSLKYKAYSRLLVIQNISGVDAYTVSKSNEFVSSLFAEVISSSSFFKLVMDSDYDIDKNYFAGSLSKQVKTWQQTVQAKNMEDSGLIGISVYHPDPEQARQIALAVNNTLITKNINYQGVGESLMITVVDQPIISSYPVKPNIPVNVVISIIFGFAIGLAYVYILGLSRMTNQADYNNHDSHYLEELHKEKQRVGQPYEHNHELKENVGINVDKVEHNGDINNILR